MHTRDSKLKHSSAVVSRRSKRVPYADGNTKQNQKPNIRNILRGPTIQPKLTIGAPNNIYEQEADRVADQVMAMPDPELQRQPENEEEEETLLTKPLADQIIPVVQRQEESLENEELQSKTKPGETPMITPSLESRISSLKGGGQPLNADVRSFFEPRFGHDFSHVRIHADSDASDTAKSVVARAFTLGKDIVFSSGQYTPGSEEGKKLLAHELTHVIQQGGLSSSQQLPTATGVLGPYRRPILNDKNYVKNNELIHTIQHSMLSSAIIQRTTSTNGFIEWVYPSGDKDSSFVHIGSRVDWLTILPNADVPGLSDMVLMFLIATKAQISNESSLVINGNIFNIRFMDDSRPNDHDIMEFMRALYTTSGNLELTENLLASVFATDVLGDITRKVLGELIVRYQPRILSERAADMGSTFGISDLGKSSEKLAEEGGSNVRDNMVTSAFSSFIATESVLEAIASEADYIDFKTRAFAVAERSGVIIRSAKKASDAAIESRKGAIDFIVDTAMDLIPMPDVSSTLMKKAVEAALKFTSSEIKGLFSSLTYDELDEQINMMTDFAEKWPRRLVNNEHLARELNDTQRSEVINDIVMISKHFRDVLRS